MKLKFSPIFSLLVFASFLINANFVSAQCGNGATQPACNPVIPNSSMFVPSVLNGIVMDDCMWVCDAGTLIVFNSTEVQVFAESGAYAQVGGDNIIVWALTGSTVVVDSGSANVFVYREAGSTLIDNGFNTLDSICATLAFDYSQAPTLGCTPLSRTQSLSFFSEVTLYPQPATDRLRYDLSLAKGGEISGGLYGVDGKLLDQWTWKGVPAGESMQERALPELATGLYVVRLTIGSDQVARKIIVQ